VAAHPASQCRILAEEPRAERHPTAGRMRHRGRHEGIKYFRPGGNGRRRRADGVERPECFPRPQRCGARVSHGGVRTGSPDGMPILGPVPGWDGLSIASGHDHVGIILSPATGELISDYVVTGDSFKLEPRTRMLSPQNSVVSIQVRLQLERRIRRVNGLDLLLPLPYKRNDEIIRRPPARGRP
jgi:hypothetical protein